MPDNIHDGGGIVLVLVGVGDSDFTKGPVNLFAARDVGGSVGLGHDDGATIPSGMVIPLAMSLLISAWREETFAAKW